jgi:hypothetical protein
MYVRISYRKDNKTAVIIGRMFDEPKADSKRVWGDRMSVFVFHKGKTYLHLDDAFKVEERIDGELQPFQYEPKPMDINLSSIVGGPIPLFDR